MKRSMSMSKYRRTFSKQIFFLLFDCTFFGVKYFIRNYANSTVDDSNETRCTYAIRNYTMENDQSQMSNINHENSIVSLQWNWQWVWLSILWLKSIMQNCSAFKCADQRIDSKCSKNNHCNHCSIHFDPSVLLSATVEFNLVNQQYRFLFRWIECMKKSSSIELNVKNWTSGEANKIKFTLSRW